jgi:hypothetical protein
MIGWEEFLSAADAERIRAYVGAQARLLQESAQATEPGAARQAL